MQAEMKDDYETDYYQDSYPGLIVRLTFQRKPHYHLLQTYCPSAVYLTIAWLALFLPTNCLAERLAMVMTIMLTLTAMFATERQSVPRVAYITLLDIWMVGKAGGRRIVYRYILISYMYFLRSEKYSDFFLLPLRTGR